MPRSPRRRAIIVEPSTPPMVTRSLTRANKSLNNLLPSKEDYPKMPALASLIASALKVNCLVSDTPSVATPVKIAPIPVNPPVPASPIAPSTMVAPTISPSSGKENDRPKRRKREPIKLPPGVAVAKLSAMDLRRLKNRISATRLRQRSQQSIQSMQTLLEYYRSRCEFLEIVVSGCVTCASLGAVQLSDIELLPAESKKSKIKSEEMSDVKELDGVGLGVLTEAECIVLDSALQS